MAKLTADERTNKNELEYVTCCIHMFLSIIELLYYKTLIGSIKRLENQT